MPKYYLVHSVVDPQPDKILQILVDAHLYSSSITNQQGISGIPLDYIHFTLLGDDVSFHGGVNFILDIDILCKRSFRYALTWIGTNIDKSTKINYRYDDVDQVLNKINAHIVEENLIDPEIGYTSHEILLKKKVNLHKYLVAISPQKKLTDKIINYIKKHYPQVVVLNQFPKSAKELNKKLAILIQLKTNLNKNWPNKHSELSNKHRIIIINNKTMSDITSVAEKDFFCTLNFSCGEVPCSKKVVESSLYSLKMLPDGKVDYDVLIYHPFYLNKTMNLSINKQNKKFVLSSGSVLGPKQYCFRNENTGMTKEDFERMLDTFCKEIKINLKEKY